MSNHSKITKEQLLRMIDNLEKNPEDKVRLLGDVGITLVGAGLGLAAAGTLATAAGATSIFGLTTAASWLGVTAVAATPVGWILGTVAAGGALTYGVSRLIRDGGLAEGRKAELLQKYKESANEMEMKERANGIDDMDKTAFIISTRELIDKDIISPEEAADLIEHVEQGRIPISQAYLLIQDLLTEKPPTETAENDIKKHLSKRQIEQLEELEEAYKGGFLSDMDFERKVTDVMNQMIEYAGNNPIAEKVQIWLNDLKQ